MVVIVTAAVTCWTVLQTGSGFGWQADPGTKYPAQDLSNLFFPGLTALQNTLNGEKAAAPQVVEKTVATQFNAIQIPWIKVGDIRQHPDRGVCTSCHFIKDIRGVPIPPILAGAKMPHDARGVCTNCHMIPSIASAPIYPQDVATADNAVQVAFVPGQTMCPTRSPGFAPMTPQAPEGDWLGIEVTNITGLTASQYQLPIGLSGVVVAQAEPPGSLGGLKAGDVILSINGFPTTTLTDFFRATNNGLMRKGALNVYRKGQQYVMAVDNTLGTTAQTDSQQGAGVAPPVAPPEGEWLGLEVAPISSLTATQYNLPSGLAGLIIIEVEAQAAALGIKAGDVLQYINGVPMTNITKFFLATKNGTLNQGAIVLWRKGEQMATMLTQTVTPNPQPMQPWMTGNTASAMPPSNPSPCPGALPGAQAPCVVQGLIPNGGTMQGGPQ